MLSRNSRFSSGASPLIRKLLSEKNLSTAVQDDDRLYRRLSALGRTKGTVATTISDYISQGNSVRKFQLDNFVKELRRYNRHQHALEIMEWMEAEKFDFTHKDYAVRLDLIARAKGIVAAENYFNGLSPANKVHCTYGALLNCYCADTIVDKALDLFSKMVKDNLVSKSLPFNNLMSMYSKLGQPEKVIPLLKEMKKMRIKPDTFTYNLLISSYSSLNDIESAERVLEEMKRESANQCNWTTYSNLAIMYIKSGHVDKAGLALKDLENEMRKRDREAYHFLISLYGKINDLHNVHRIWMSLKLTLKVVTNKCYLLMLRTLTNLNDIHGVKKCYDEWESTRSSFDIRLAETAIGAFLTHGMVEEAESVLQSAISSSKGPFFNAWELFMFFFLRNNQITKALEMMKTAVATKVRDDIEWRPKSSTVESFLKAFKTEGDVNGAEEFYKCMESVKCVDEHVYKALLKTYVAAEATMPEMRERIKRDGIEVSNEMIKLLASVCPKP